MLFSENCSAVATKTYWAIKREENVNMTTFFLLAFCNYVILVEHILNNKQKTILNINNISETDISSVISHQLSVSWVILISRLSDQLPDVLLQDFFIHYMYVLCHFYFYNFSILEKSQFCLLLKTILLHFFYCE